MAQRGGNERYHVHDRQQDDDGQCSGRDWPPGRGDARRMGCVARAGGPGVAVAPADTSPLLDAAPAQRLPIFGDESAQHHFAYVHEALSVDR